MSKSTDVDRHPSLGRAPDGIETQLSARFLDLGLPYDVAEPLGWNLANATEAVDRTERMMRANIRHREEYIREAAAAGMSYREIAAVVGLSHQRVSQIVTGEEPPPEEVKIARTCEACGKELENWVGNRRKYCSDKCRTAKYAGVCVDCGKPTSGRAGPGKAPQRCRSCGARVAGMTKLERSRALSRPRDERYAALWRAGATHRELAAEFGVSLGMSSQWVTRLRGEGFDVPYRRTPEERARMGKRR